MLLPDTKILNYIPLILILFISNQRLGIFILFYLNLFLFYFILFLFFKYSRMEQIESTYRQNGRATKQVKIQPIKMDPVNPENSPRVGDQPLMI